MKTDVNGCSTTAAGQEQFEEFRSSLSERALIQYDYRAPSGQLFSCVASSLDAAREKRDKWLATL